MNKHQRIIIWTLLLGSAARLLAQAPQWWTDRGVLRAGSAPHDFNPVNQGQVKWMCLKAYEELQEKLPGIGNADILDQIDTLPSGNNFRPANQGMLKAIALPFYERLIAEGYVQEVPWAAATNASRNHALANQGQLKNLFNFDLDAFDSDGDGLPDWWENKYGALVAGADEDGDGVSNLQEYQQGSNPLVADFVIPSSENTPVGDGSVNPPAGDLTDALIVNGSSVSATTGAWVLDGSAVYAVGRRGGLTYKADLPQGDMYRLQLSVRQQTIVSAKSHTYSLRFAVDGEFVARRSVKITGSGVQTAVLDTPFLDAGNHTIELFWENYENEIALRVEKLTLQQYPGADSDSSGIKDWVENRLMARNTIDVSPLESRTSPVCLEGRGLFTGAMQVGGSDSVSHGANDRWFANAALDAEGSLTQIGISFENGGRLLSRAIRWKPTNLLTEPLAGIVIRRGDALRLTAVLPGMVSGTSEIKVGGQSLGTCSITNALGYRFEQDGLYSVEGSASGLDAKGNPLSYSRSVQIRVVGADSETVAAQVNQWRPWSVPATWPAEAVAEWDNRVQRQTAEGIMSLLSTVPEERYGVIRLGENGPVLAPVTVKGFNLWFMKNTYLHYDEIYADGSFKAETTMIISPMVPEIRINQRCRGVIAYEDGSRVRDFYLSDFNPSGEVRIIFCHSSPIATSVCHYTDVYQGTVLIGRSY